MRISCFAALLATASAVLQAKPAVTDDLQVVVASQDGQHVAAQLPLPDEQLTSARHLWAWTTTLPPRKLEVRKTSQSTEAVLAELRRLPARVLNVRVHGWSRPEELAPLRIIAAPAEMWASVPETLLPTFALSKEGLATIRVRDPVRVRVVGVGFGTIWEDVARKSPAIDISLRRPAVDAEVTLRSSDGGTVGRVQALAMSQRRDDAAPAFQARFASEDKTPIRIQALPESEVITLFVITEKTAPHIVSGTAAELSRTIVLPPSAQIHGRFVDEEDRPLSGVKVEAEGFVSPDAPVASRGDTVSDERGQWLVSNLPRVNVIVQATAPGRSVFRRRVALQEGDVDLGTVALPAATRVVVTVADRDGKPVENVTVEANGFTGQTDKEGSVTLTGLPASDASAMTLTANGFAKHTVQLIPPLPEEEHVVLERAFSVRGQVIVTGSDAPAADATAVVTIGPRYRREAVHSDGTFSYDVDSGEEFSLIFESPATAAVVRNELPGRAGEVRDLGTIRLPSGLAIRGRITDSAAAPVAGARIWTLRPSAGGTVTAWAGGRMVQTTTDPTGAFELRGLAAGPALVRFDAPDFARTYREVVVESIPLDLGVIELDRGRTVTVKVNRDDAVAARIDLRGHSLDADMITAPVVEGEARLRHVPAGRYRITVVSGPAVICDRRVDVSDAADSSVECPPPTTIRGHVLLGGTPAAGGTLTWLQPAQTDALINTRFSPMGASQQRVYGLGGGLVVVAVRPDGTFETDQLRPGEWHVGWRSTDSEGTPDRPFIIPDGPQAPIVLEFDGAIVRGRVVDKRGEPVSGARVREIQGSLYAMAAVDGSFTITGVSPGVHRLQATLGARTSRVVDVIVERGKRAPETKIEIGDEEQNVLSIRVLGLDGQPKPNAFVFVEMAGGFLKSVSADVNGVATATVGEGLPNPARLVAYADNAWAFGETHRTEDDSGAQAVIRFGRTGRLLIRSKTVSGAPVLRSSQVPGDLGWMIARIGSFLAVAPESPLALDGLPAGSYEIFVDAAQVTASVKAGATTTADLP